MNLPVVLFLTNSGDATSDYLSAKLHEAGINTYRLDTDIACCDATFLYRECVPVLKCNNRTLCSQHILSVIYRRPKEINVSGDILDATTRRHTAGEWSEAIEGFLAHVDEHKWINHPSCNYMASHKVEQLTRARMYGLRVPESVVTNDHNIAEEFVHSQSEGVIVKPLASGFIEREKEDGDTIIYTSEFHQSDIHFLDDLSTCPVIFQQKIRKVLDVRMTVVDDKAIAVGLRGVDTGGNQRLDIRRDNMNDVYYEVLEIPPTILSSVKKILSFYRLRFAALDFVIENTGEWVFLEINPNGQWAWLDLCANAEISNAFVEAITGEYFV